MKIGIISINLYPKDLNCACPLHGYAMQKFLEKNGYESEIIDYTPIDFGTFDMRHPTNYYKTQYEEHLKNFPTSSDMITAWYKRGNFLKRRLESFSQIYKERETRYDKFQSFINRYLKITSKGYNSDSLEFEDPGFDCYICATDVIWKCEPTFDRAFFLASKCMENKWKISYAASRNSSYAKTEQEEELFFHYLSDFDAISVREASLKNYIEEKSDFKASLVIDPVMLHNKEFYEKIAKRPVEQDYLFLDIVVKKADDTVEKAVQYAKTHNLKIIEFSDRQYLKGYFDDRDYVEHKWYYDLGIEEWLGYIMYANCIFTNSFHCSCFSILFGREFFVGWRNGDKVDHVLETFNLKDRHFNDETDFSVSIDYDQVNTILQLKRKESGDFLLNALKNIEGKIRPRKDYSTFRCNITYPVLYNMCLPDGGKSHEEKLNNSPVFSPKASSHMVNNGTAKLMHENIELFGYRFMGWNLRFQIDNAWYWILKDNSFCPMSQEVAGLPLRLFKENDIIPYIPVNKISKMAAEAVWEKFKPTLGFAYHSGKNAKLFSCSYSKQLGKIKTTNRGGYEYWLFDNIENNGEATFPENKFLPKNNDSFKLDFMGWHLRFYANANWYWYMSDGTTFPANQHIPDNITIKLFNPGEKLPIIPKEFISKAVAVADWIFLKNENVSCKTSEIFSNQTIPKDYLEDRQMDYRKFKVEYAAVENTDKKMEATVVNYGVPTQLRKNIYKRKGFQFIGWKAYRTSDGKTCYSDKNKNRKFFVENKQPEGWKLYIYKDTARVSQLSRVDNDLIIMYPQWKKDNASDENKKILEERIRSRPIVLFGGYDQCMSFYEKYSQKLEIRCILLDSDENVEKELNGITVQPFMPKNLLKNDYVIICRPVKIRQDEAYRNAKKAVTHAGLTMMKDFVRADIAELVLDRKKLWIWLGYCQLNTLCNDVFSKLESIRNEWVLTSFRYGLNTLPKSYKYDDFKELLTLCDCLAYVPLFAANDKIDFDIEDYLAPNAMKIKIPRIPFGAYYPWREKDDENFFKYTVDGKLHWPFAYEERVIDDLILKGLSDDEIYNELMKEDLYSEEEIKKKIKTSYKLIEISEKTCNIKILDFIKENLTKRILYRDGLHYQNFLYFELARRISAVMGLECENEINDLETKIEKTGRQYIDYTEIPILPCVAKVLKLDFITDETLYRVKFTENGAWRGTKVKVRLMNRKEWIYTYAKYARALITLREIWLM